MKSTFNYSRVLLFILVTTFISCNNSDDGNDPPQGVFSNFSDINFIVGVNDIELVQPNTNIIWRFRMVVPQGASDNNKRPLIVCLHGAATAESETIHQNTECLEQPGLASLDAYLLCPNSDASLWNQPSNENKVLTLTNLAKSNLFVDVDKVAVMGYSDGGNGSWHFAQYHPEAFSAAIPMASLYNPVRIDAPTMISIPMYVIHGAQDELFPLETTQGFVDVAIDAGTDLEFVVIDDLGHFDVCDYVPYLQEAADWLENEVW